MRDERSSPLAAEIDETQQRLPTAKAHEISIISRSRSRTRSQSRARGLILVTAVVTRFSVNAQDLLVTKRYLRAASKPVSVQVSVKIL